jgi:hypothetical protein
LSAPILTVELVPLSAFTTPKLQAYTEYVVPASSIGRTAVDAGDARLGNCDIVKLAILYFLFCY